MKPRRTNMILWFWAIIISILTFGTFNTDLFPGIDPSYQWALNYLFAYDREYLSLLNFQFGPLGFLMFPKPIGNNLAIGISAYFFLKTCFVWLCLKTCQRFNVRRFWTYFIAIVLSSISGLPLLFFGCCAFLILLSLNGNSFWLYIAVLLAVVGLFIKSSIGVICLSMLGMHVILKFYDQKNVKELLKITLIGLAALLLTSSILLNGPTAFVSYLLTVTKLSGAYSSSFSQFPDNNWLLLTAYLLIVTIGVYHMRSRWDKTYWPILLLPLFATWKHAMGREDPGHYYSLVYFTVLFWALFIIHSSKGRTKLMLAVVVCVGLLHANYEQIWGKRSYDFVRINTEAFQQQVLNFAWFENKAKQVNDSTLQQLKLQDALLKRIGDKSVDVYPWQLLYLPSNELNWQPRTTLQSLTFSSWFDTQSAASLKKQAPDYLLWHWTKDRFGGDFGSIDRRYQLNDDPRTLAVLFENYSCVDVWEKGIVLKKRQLPLKTSNTIVKIEDIKWNQWVTLPNDGNLKGELEIHASLWGKVVGFLYKEPAIFISYRLENGQEVSYRMLRSAAKDGLWLNPLRRYFFEASEQQVVAFKISTEYEDQFQEHSALKFVSVQMEEGGTLFSNLLDNCQSFVSKETFQLVKKSDSLFWTNQTLAMDSLDFAEKMIQEANGQSELLSVLPSKNDPVSIRVALDVSEKTAKSGADFIVSAISNENEHFWKALKLNVLNSTIQQWNSLSFSVDIPEKNRGDELRIYVNTKADPLVFRNLKVDLIDIK